MNYTEQANHAIQIAKKIAKELTHPYVGTEHLLLGLGKVPSGVAAQAMAANGVSEENVRKVIKELVSPVEQETIVARPEISPRLEYILELAQEDAVTLHSAKIGTEHMLLAIIRETDCVAARILLTMGINLQKIMQDILVVIGADAKEYLEDISADNGKSKGEILEQYGTDLTAEAADGKLDPVIGRKTEIDRLLQILSRRNKNNPCLIGEPGVGKTAVVEGLAARIAQGLVPENMMNKRIFTMDLAGMVAGTKYRGEFEERMKKLIQEVKTAGDVILFLDEIHTIVGAGGAEGALNAANILKPALARGEVQMMGATTIAEFRKHFEKDAALERRFQPVTIEEPTKEMCVEILKGLQKKYEEHHQVEIEEKAIEEAVQLAERYINERFLPDKAIDVLDEACSKVRLRGFKIPENITELEVKITTLAQDFENAIRIGDMSLASEIKKERIETQKKLDQAKRRFEKRIEGRKLSVTSDDIAVVVAEWSKIPVQKLQESEGTRLQKLEQILHKRVIGQEEAVSAVSKAVRRGRIGLKDPKRPIGSFLFLGPTGVGKTELAKTLSEALFGSEESMIRVDMSEYMEKHSVAKMIGSPPGYVGHDDGGQLSERVRRRPYSVVLFDEIEKAHPDVFNILLQVLDDGHITDSQGRKVDFKNTVIIMTSNAGAQTIIDPKKLGFNAKEDAAGDYKRMKNSVMNEIKNIFRPEFLNRIDEILVFHPLGKDEMKKIVNLMCKDLVKRAKEQLGIELTIRDMVKVHIIETGTNQKFGARPLRRAVQNQLEDKMAEALLDGSITSNSEVIATISKKEIKFVPKTTKS